jgi:hypothetical protein
MVFEAVISHVLHTYTHRLSRLYLPTMKCTFLCLTKKVNLKMIFIVGIKKIDNANCYVQHQQKMKIKKTFFVYKVI